jgi:hypothetical protein
MSLLDGPYVRCTLSERAAAWPTFPCRVEAMAPVLWMPFVTLPDGASCVHLEPRRTAHGWVGACSSADGSPARGASASAHNVLA